MRVDRRPQTENLDCQHRRRGDEGQFLRLGRGGMHFSDPHLGLQCAANRLGRAGGVHALSGEVPEGRHAALASGEQRDGARHGA